MTLSKGISAGTLPLSLVLTTEPVYQSFWSDEVARGFLHSHSYTGNPLACAAANAVLDRFTQTPLLAELQVQAQCLRDAFAPFQDDVRLQHLRQRGTILAFDVKQEVAGVRFAERFHLAAREHALLIRPIGNTVYLMPPYLMNPEVARWLANAVRQTFNTVLHA